jgi:undecaprenyl diphosphate synthase
MNSLNHVAIIMDGNGRWAQLRGKPRIYGHIKGARVAKKIITQAADSQLDYLTLYTFSSENWGRPPSEVQFLLKLLERYLQKETDNLVKKNIKFTIIGNQEKLPATVKKLIDVATQKTVHCTGLQVCFAISYSFREEMIAAIKNISSSVASNAMNIDGITETVVSKALMTKDRPDPDLVVRTSGEYRLSNFLMWQCAYSELFFTETLWPDFSADEFIHICKNYFLRNRRYGKVSDSPTADKESAQKNYPEKYSEKYSDAESIR